MDRQPDFACTSESISAPVRSRSLPLPLIGRLGVRGREQAGCCCPCREVLPVTDPSHRETPEAPPMTDAEKQALVERERARMAEPGYRESLVPPPDTPEPRAVRPLPGWMPTPEELHRWKYDWLAEECNLALEDEFRLVDAVRWLLEERENRL